MGSGGAVAIAGFFVMIGVIVFAFLGEAVGRPLCRALFGRPVIATAGTLTIVVVAAAVASGFRVGPIAIGLLIWSWGWVLGGVLTGEWRRSDRLREDAASGEPRANRRARRAAGL